MGSLKRWDIQAWRILPGRCRYHTWRQVSLCLHLPAMVHSLSILPPVLPGWDQKLPTVRPSPSAADSPIIWASPRTSVFNDLQFLGGSFKWVTLPLSAHLTSFLTSFISSFFKQGIMVRECTERDLWEHRVHPIIFQKRKLEYYNSTEYTKCARYIMLYNKMLKTVTLGTLRVETIIKVT